MSRWGDNLKTLIFNGSPREDGDTAMLIDVFTSHLEGERKIINVFDCIIESCNDCRYCWTNEGCSIQDEMQEVYDYIQDCDNILIASPIFFSELTGQLLVVASRLQTYFCAKNLRNETPIDKSKKGGIILVQGGTFTAEKAAETSAMLLKTMNATEIVPPIFCRNTDHLSPVNNAEVIEKVKQIANSFNRRS
jgi:multimeric flavodoxin WrbA